MGLVSVSMSSEANDTCVDMVLATNIYHGSHTHEQGQNAPLIKLYLIDPCLG